MTNSAINFYVKNVPKNLTFFPLSLEFCSHPLFEHSGNSAEYGSIVYLCTLCTANIEYKLQRSQNWCTVNLYFIAQNFTIFRICRPHYVGKHCQGVQYSLGSWVGWQSREIFGSPDRSLRAFCTLLHPSPSGWKSQRELSTLSPLNIFFID